MAFITETTGLNICLILAHHDDEVLFFGGLLHRIHQYSKIHLITVCDVKNENTGHDTNRKAQNYGDVCGTLGITSVELGLDTRGRSIQELASVAAKMKGVVSQLDLVNRDISSMRLQRAGGERSRQKPAHQRLLDNRRKLKERRSELCKEERKIMRQVKVKECDAIHPQEIMDAVKASIQGTGIEFDYILTHNALGEYGHIDHMIVNYAVALMRDFFKFQIIMTTSNEITDMRVKVDKSAKFELVKKYDFKDTKEKTNVWFHQAMSSYSFWLDNDYEYLKVME